MENKTSGNRSNHTWIAEAAKRMVVSSRIGAASWSFFFILLLASMCAILFVSSFDCMKYEGWEQEKLATTRQDNENRDDAAPRIHVAYLHHLNSHVGETIENFVYFMNFAYKPCSPHAFFTIIFNVDSEQENVTLILNQYLGGMLMKRVNECLIENETFVDDYMNSHQTRSGFFKNTRIIKRINTPGDDICAYTELFISEYWLKLEAWFRYFFFINSTVRGPFLPVYYHKPWWSVFIDMLEYSNDTVAVGPYMSCEVNPHLQSFFLSLDRRGLAEMKRVFRCPKSGESEQSLIFNTEVKLGATLLAKNYSMRSLLFVYNGAGSAEQISRADCTLTNPFMFYPIRSNERDLVYRDYPSLQNLTLSINVFEVTWVRYKENSGHSYIDLYVPLFTQLMYKRLRTS